MSLIRTEKNTLFVSFELLQTPRAWAWVGFGWGPRDNDDDRVTETRVLMEKFYPYIPYGMFIGNTGSDGSKIPAEQEDGFYRLDLSEWSEGVYRLSFHTELNVPSTVGSVLNSNLRDRNVSWMPLERILEQGSHEERAFLHREENGAGFSIRILIWPDRTVSAFGDSAQSAP